LYMVYFIYGNGNINREDGNRLSISIFTVIVIIVNPNDHVAVGRHHHPMRAVEARGRALPVCEARSSVTRERADSAVLGHETQGRTRHHHVAGRVQMMP
jgi:hypothetical protein